MINGKLAITNITHHHKNNFLAIIIAAAIIQSYRANRDDKGAGEMKSYTTCDKAKQAARKRSLFASLNGKFSQFDVIAIDGQFYVVESGKYPKHTFWTIIHQYCGGYSI